MTAEIVLIPKTRSHWYMVEQDIFYMHEGERVKVESVDVEEDPHHPEHFTMSVFVKPIARLDYSSSDYGTWPLVARRLYRMHVAALRQAGLHV